MAVMTRRKLTPMLLVFRNFNSQWVVHRLAGDQKKAGAEAPATSGQVRVDYDPQPRSCRRLSAIPWGYTY